MSSSPDNNIGAVVNCDFASPGLSASAAWRVTLDFLTDAGIAADSYSWHAQGSRRHRNRNIDEILPGHDILRALEVDEATALNIYVLRGNKRQEFNLAGPYPKIPWQIVTLSSQIPEMSPKDWSPLIERLARRGRLIVGVLVDMSYSAWQRCRYPRVLEF